MTASTNRIPAWLAAIVVVVGIAFAVGVGFWSYRSSIPPLHTDPQKVSSVAGIAPAKWLGAVEKGRQLARANLVSQNLPGLSVAVGLGADGAGEIVWSEGFGWADLETRAPVAPGMRFRIGHTSKPLTSAAVGLLREKDRLHLEDEIQRYVPAFPRKEWPITLRQLMANTAGVRHYKDDEWGDKPSVRCEWASEGLQSFANEPLLFEPGTQYRYSTYGWVLVSAAVEAVAKEPFSTFMRTQIFTPLGMADTRSDSATEPIPNRVTSYFRGNLGREITTNVDYSCFAGAGAFLSTPSDLVRFGMALSGDTFLRPATVTMLQTRQPLTSGEETDYGLGWMLESVELSGERTRVAGHASRTIEGASTSFLTFPERGMVVAVMSNISFADTKSIALGIAEAFAEQAKRQAR